MTEYKHLSIHALESIIENGEKVLKNKQALIHKEVISQIRDLAASINVNVEIHETEKKSVRKGVKVPIKYIHPVDNDKTWTGRGVAPKWMQELLNLGHQRSEFEI